LELGVENTCFVVVGMGTDMNIEITVSYDGELKGSYKFQRAGK